MMRKLVLAIVCLLSINSGLIAQAFTVPYTDDFESGAPGWTSNINFGSTGSEWELGYPNFGLTTGVHSGNSCWDISLDAGYLNNTSAYLQSPKFDFSGASVLQISFWMNYKTEQMWDGTVLQYSFDTTQGWNVLASAGAQNAINWYTDPNINANNLPGWSGNNSGWQYSTIITADLAGHSEVWFRFLFASDASVVFDGVSIDDFSVNPAEANSISGTVYLDQNQNNVYDASDIPFPPLPLYVTSNMGINYYLNPNISGNYSAIADSGATYTITPQVPQYAVVSPSSYVKTLNSTNQIDSGNNFLVTFIPGIKDAVVSLYGNGVRPGFNHYNVIEYWNAGTDVLSGTISFNYDTAFTFVNSTSPATVTGPNSLEFVYSLLLPGEHRYIHCNFDVNANLVVGSNTMIDATINPITGDTLPSNNYALLNRTATNSCDPNEKLVDPSGDITTNQVASGLDLNYTINFQNTGTADAININIFDVIDDNLDLSTFRITGFSHPITSWNISSNRQLQVVFQNINLPDSNANELLSHGFLKYSIKPINILTNGSQISNIADIIFDNNLPVITNQVITLIQDPLGISSVEGASSFNIIPNPNSGSFTVDLKNLNEKPISIQLFNSIGELVISENITTVPDVYNVSMDGAAKGMYTLVISTAKSTFNKKFIIQ